MSITINKITGRDDLHRQYQGQSEAQDCYIELDCRAETLSASYNAEIGNAVPFSVFHGHEQRFGIPCLTADAANGLLTEILPLAERIVAGYESEWDGNNLVARFSDDAQAAIDEISEICNIEPDESNSVQACEAGEWLGCVTYAHYRDGYVVVDDHRITAIATDDEISEIAEKIESYAESENITFSDSVEKLLEYFRDNCDGPDWDAEEKRFDFPPSYTEDEEKRFETLAEYNAAYDLEITDLNDAGYLLYAKMRKMISENATGIRLKHDGPYNPECRKTILSSMVQGYDGRIFQDASKWTPVVFMESEALYFYCRAHGTAYPWKLERETRIKNAAYKMAHNAASEISGLKSAYNETVRKISELETERDRLNARITEQQEKYDAVAKSAEQWKTEMLAK